MSATHQHEPARCGHARTNALHTLSACYGLELQYRTSLPTRPRGSKAPNTGASAKQGLVMSAGTTAASAPKAACLHPHATRKHAGSIP